MLTMALAAPRHSLLTRAVGVERDPIPRSFVAEMLSPVTFRRLVRRRRDQEARV